MLPINILKARKVSILAVNTCISFTNQSPTSIFFYFFYDFFIFIFLDIDRLKSVFFSFLNSLHLFTLSCGHLEQKVMGEP